MSIFRKLTTRAARPLIGLAALALCSAAAAEPLLYQLSGTGSGMLGMQVFNNATIMIEGRGDSLNVIEIDPGIYLNALESVSVRITGQGSASATEAFYFFVNQGGQTAGFTVRSIGDINDFSAAALASWDGTTRLGPLSVSSSLLAPFDTDHGTFHFNNATGLSFMASPVPEPGQWGLLLAGGAMLAGVVRTRKRAAAPQVGFTSGPAA